MEHEWQAGGRHDGIGGDVRLTKHLRQAAAHICGAQEQPRRIRPVDDIEIEEAGDNVGQWIQAQRVQLIGGKGALQVLGEDEGGRHIQAPASQHHVEDGPLHRAEPGGVADLRPEVVQHLLRLRTAAGGQSLDQRGRVHRPGAGSTDADNVEPFVLQQAVQNAPCEGAVRAPALQRDVDLLRFFGWHPHLLGPCIEWPFPL